MLELSQLKLSLARGVMVVTGQDVFCCNDDNLVQRATIYTYIKRQCKGLMEAETMQCMPSISETMMKQA